MQVDAMQVSHRRLRPPALGVAASLLVAIAFSATSLLSAQERVSPPEAPAEEPYSIVQLEREVERLRGGAAKDLGLALQELTYAYVYHGRPDEAVEAARESLELLELAGDTSALAQTHHDLGLAHWNLVQYDSAVAQFSRARDLWVAVEAPESLGRVYNNLGAAHYQWGNYELALSSFLRALEYRREAGQEAGQALALANVGRTYHDWGQHERARIAYQQSIEISDRMEYAFGQAYARLNLGELFLDQGEWDRAEEHFLASLDHYGSDTGSIPPAGALGGRILNSLGLGTLRMQRGEHEAGIALLQETLETAQEADNPRLVARARLELGNAYQVIGEYDEAFRHLSLGLEAARDRDQRPIALDLLAALAQAQELRAVPDRALANLQAYVALRDSIFDQGAVQRIAAMEAEAEVERRERENALLREEQRIREAVIERQRVSTLLAGGLLLMTVLLVGVMVRFNRRGREREKALSATNRSLEQTNRDLREARSELNTLKGLIPICSHCKRVRDDEGYWESVESYVGQRSDAFFSHSICADCGIEEYPADWDGAA